MFRHKYNEKLTYDKRGNILTLQRNGLNGGTFTTGQGYTAGTFGMIDNLTYSIDDKNQLTKIIESSLPSKGFKSTNTTTAPFNYMYDANGNLILDLNKGIDEIQYNYLNLPTFIRFKGGGGYIPTIAFVYDATGVKLRKIVKVTNGGTSIVNTTYDYIGGVEYKNNSLERISNTEGAVTKNASGVYESFPHFIRFRYKDSKCDSSWIMVQKSIIFTLSHDL